MITLLSAVRPRPLLPTPLLLPANLLLLANLLLADPAAAQTHAQSELILGNCATLTASSPNGLFALFVLSQSGVGAGGCVPGVGCLGVLDPLLLSPLVAAEPDGVCRFSFVVPATLPPSPLASQAVLLEPGVFVLSNAVDGAIEPLSAFDDDFAGTALADGWQILNPQLLQHSVAAGELHLQPTAGGPAATWFADGEGPAVYRVVRGDFTVIASLRAFRLSDPSLPPPANYDMGGLTLRDPASVPGARDWLHVALGGGVPGNPIAVEDKSTDDSVSDLMLHAIPVPHGEVRATRQGDLISFYHRVDDTVPWTLLRSHLRPDLGPELQVGPIVFSWSPTVDVGVSFDRIAFSRP